MGVLRSMRAVLLALVACSAFGEDEVALIQQSVSSLASLGQSSVHDEVGEFVQVKLKGQDGWVDCTVTGEGELPDSLNIKVPSMQDKAFHDVPRSMVRKVYKGFEVNIDSGDEESNTTDLWVPCMVLDKTGEKYTVELQEFRPGFAIEGVSTSLLRENRVRTEKKRHLEEMLAENEAAKAQLFYIAQMKPNEIKIKAEADKKKKADEEQGLQAARFYVWEEMAKRAEKEEADLKLKEKEELEKELKKKAKKNAKLKAKMEEKIAEMEARAETDPLAALAVKAREASKVAAAANSKLEKVWNEEIEEARKLQQTKKQLKEQQAKDVAAQMEARKRMSEENRPHTAEQMALAAEKRGAYEAFELQQRKQRNLLREELSSLEDDEDKKFREEEEVRQAAMQEHRKASIRKQLEAATLAFGNDETPNKEKSLSNLMTAVMQWRSDMGAAEVDGARSSLVTQITSNARQLLAKGMESASANEVSKLLQTLPGKAKDIDRVWNGVQDSDLKMKLASHFEVAELQPLKEKLPQLQMNEVKLARFRTGISAARTLGGTAALREAIDKGEAAGLPAKEIQAARAFLHFKEMKPVHLKNIEEAKKSGDAQRLMTAIASGEAAGIDAGVLHSARHVLNELQKAPVKAHSAPVHALSAMAP